MHPNSAPLSLFFADSWRENALYGTMHFFYSASIF